MEKPKELLMFVVSMSDSMGTLFPAPIDMAPIDDPENEDVPCSRWAQCSRIIQLMTSNLAGCNVDLAVAKNSDIGISTTRGNGDDRYQPIHAQLQNISATCQSNGLANPEHGIREISKIMMGEYEKKSIHWFLDVETFLEFIPTSIPVNFQNLTIYVIGELRTFHENLMTAKSVTAHWNQFPGVKIRLLTCRADLEQLKKEVRCMQKLEFRSQSVQCFVSHEQFEIQLHSKSSTTAPKSRLSAVSVIGFLPEQELFRLTSTPLRGSIDSESSFHVSPVSKLSQEVLYSIGRHLLSKSKSPLVCLCQCFSQKGTFSGYGFVVASMTVPNRIELRLILNKQVSEKISQRELKLASEVAEPRPPAPDESYMPLAPVDTKLIKKRILEMDCLPPEVKKRKFAEMVDEYKILNTDEALMKHIANWQKKANK